MIKEIIKIIIIGRLDVLSAYEYGADKQSTGPVLLHPLTVHAHCSHYKFGYNMRDETPPPPPSDSLFFQTSSKAATRCPRTDTTIMDGFTSKRNIYYILIYIFMV